MGGYYDSPWPRRSVARVFLSAVNRRTWRVTQGSVVSFSNVTAYRHLRNATTDFHTYDEACAAAIVQATFLRVDAYDVNRKEFLYEHRPET